MKWLAALLPPKAMPEPGPNCRIYDIERATLLFDNREHYVAQSAATRAHYHAPYNRPRLSRELHPA